MKILCEINDPVIKRACYLVETHYADYEFGELLKGVSFNYTPLTGDAVFLTYKKELDGRIVKVTPYQTWNPWSAVVGYAQDDTIFVNTRKLYLPLADRVENIFHETTHLAGFSHKGNRVNEFNLKTVPYQSASLFVNFLKSKGLLT